MRTRRFKLALRHIAARAFSALRRGAQLARGRVAAHIASGHRRKTRTAVAVFVTLNHAVPAHTPAGYRRRLVEETAATALLQPRRVLGLRAV